MKASWHTRRRKRTQGGDFRAIWENWGQTKPLSTQEVGDYAGTLGLDEYIIVGKLSQNIAEGIKASGNEDRIRSFASVEALFFLQELRDCLKKVTQFSSRLRILCILKKSLRH